MTKEGHRPPEFSAELQKQIENPEVRAADISRSLPEMDGTKIIIQRHERYQRSGESLGSLTPESAQKAYDQSRQLINDMLRSVPEQERTDVQFLVVGSNTKFRGEGMRSMETAGQVLRALHDELSEEHLNASQIENQKSVRKDVAPITRMQAPRFLDDSKEYFDLLLQRYGDETQEFWKAFEEDSHKEERLRLGAEGPDEMDQRFTNYLRALTKYAEYFHKTNPGKRLVVWAVSHYDTVSPFIKRHITKSDPHQYLAIDYGAGVSIEVDPQGNLTSRFQGTEYQVDL